jgi:thiamine biosynthesis lipoprotein
VKGWAIDRAEVILRDAGARSFALNAGGDLLVRGGRGTGQPWRVGIRHPRIADRLACVIALAEGAVATSGGYERGDHIADPAGDERWREVLSVTLSAAHLATADAYATAAFAMGRDGARWLAMQPGVEACVVTADDRLITTSGLPRLG